MDRTIERLKDMGIQYTRKFGMVTVLWGAHTLTYHPAHDRCDIDGRKCDFWNELRFLILEDKVETCLEKLASSSKIPCPPTFIKLTDLQGDVVYLDRNGTVMRRTGTGTIVKGVIVKETPGEIIKALES